MNLQHSEKDGTVTFEVRVLPRSSKSEITGEHDGALKVKLSSPPVDGAANDELIKLLAKEFSIPKSNVDIVRGHSSKIKKVRITGISTEQIAAILQSKS